MSTYGFSSSELGLTLHSRKRYVHSTFVPETLHDAAPGESELEKKYGINLEQLKKYVREHLLSDVEKTIIKGGFTEAEIGRMYQYCQEETDFIESLTAETITEDILIWLIQKSNSYSEELHDIEHGNAYSSSKPDDLAVIQRVRLYTEPQDK